ncbi:CPBP family intramembrane glutamic endopeptidase [Aridibaculum aurantiacum]|uniref:CPBP family intramembrane glutamic endopeptidase n=1 Tax=Aridibaculum aurantiacum TaxID=2810307 RepID=UPI001A977FA9|nr:CPBP family intramembrane glutamic endopeptidase [Aridibaculum aurantiacum]
MVAIFFIVLAAFTIPLIIISQQYGWEVTIAHQAIIVIAATLFCQLMRRKPMSELTGGFNLSAVKNCLIGIVAGALLMLFPAMFLMMCGFIDWQLGSGDVLSILNTTGVFILVAVAEEFLFRGFIFQRLRKSTGVWIAQLMIAAYFLLTHINNPGMTGTIKMLASINIFIASMMFGFAYIKTNSLVMPIAMHFMANWVQGTLLGFGVSGNEQARLMKPSFGDAPQWLTGGSFGLEASVPGLVCVIVTTFLLYRWKPIQAIEQSVTGKLNEEKTVTHSF